MHKKAKREEREVRRANKYESILRSQLLHRSFNNISILIIYILIVLCCMHNGESTPVSQFTIISYYYQSTSKYYQSTNTNTRSTNTPIVLLQYAYLVLCIVWHNTRVRVQYAYYLLQQYQLVCILREHYVEYDELVLQQLFLLDAYFQQQILHTQQVCSCNGCISTITTTTLVDQPYEE